MKALNRNRGGRSDVRIWVSFGVGLLLSAAVFGADSQRPFRFRFFAYGQNQELIPGPGEYQTNLIEFRYGSRVPVEMNPTESGSQPAFLSEIEERSPGRPPRIYSVDRWTRDQGLPGNKVRVLTQSRDGFLWVGTANGLARFDGVRFTAVPLPNGDAAVNQPSIRCLCEDAEGVLWIGTGEGLFRWTLGRDVESMWGEVLSERRINGLIRRRGGGVWVATSGGIGFIKGGTYQSVPALAGENAFCIEEGDGGRLWVGMDYGVAEIRIADGSVTRRFLDHAPDEIGSPTRNRVLSLLLDHKRRLWIGAAFGVWRLPDPAGLPEPVRGLERISYARLAEDSGGGVWVSSELETAIHPFGVLRVGGEDEQVQSVEIERAIHGAMSVTADREGVVWVGGRGGLFRLKEHPIATVAWGTHGSLGQDYRVIGFGPRGVLWFSSTQWWGRWSGSTLNMCFLIDGPRMRFIQPLLPLTHPDVPSRGFVGPFGEHPFFSPDPESVPASFSFRVDSALTALTPRRDGTLWIATKQGLFRVSSPTQMEKVHPPLASDILALEEDSHSRLWVGTAAHGLFRWDGTALQALPGSADVLAAITAIHADDDDRVWLGTSAGLRLMDRETLREFGPGSGLPQGPIHGVLEDGARRLWVAHVEGLHMVFKDDLIQWIRDPEAPVRIIGFGPEDGLLLRGGAGMHPCAKGPDGRLWFGRRGGLEVVDPSEIQEAPPPQVFLERVVANGESFPPALDGSRLRLPPGAGRRLEFQFTATTLHSPERARFRSRLEGYDSGWRDTGGERIARYQNLPEGHYTFRVQARNHQGRWSDRDAVLALHVVPHFWETGVFRAAAGIVVGGGLGSVALWGFRRQRRSLASRHHAALEGERSRIARDLHDHLGANLTRAALSPAAASDRDGPIRESLHELRDLIWMVHPENDSLESLVGFIGDCSIRFLAEAGLDLRLDLPDAFPDCSIPGAVRGEIAGALKESLRNVGEHALAARVVVRVRVDGEQFLLTVEDDGRGFDATAAAVRRPRSTGRGHGLPNLHSRCAALGGECRIRTAPGGGTRVDFILPLATLRTISLPA